MGNDLQKYEPKTLVELKEFATDIAGSQLVPQSMRGKPADIVLALQLGKELGLSTVQSLQSVAIVNGKPAIFGDAALALVMGSGLCENIHESVENGVATCRVTRKGMEEQSRTFSIDDAKKAKLWGRQGPWTQYDQRMLQLRARGFALRDLFPDVLRGVITQEEAQDYPAPAGGKLPPMPPPTEATPAPRAPEFRQDPNDDRTAAEARVTAEGFPELTPTDATVVEPTVEKAEKKPGFVTAAQIKKIQSAIRAAGLDYKNLKPKICEGYGIESLKELPASMVDDVLDRVAAAGKVKKDLEAKA